MSRAFFQRFHQRSSAPASPITGWLEKDSHQLLQTANKYLELEKKLQSCLPTGLKLCKVAHIDRQQLTIAVPSAAHATKLRQLVPSLLQQLQSHGQFNQIHVQIQSVFFTEDLSLGRVQQGGYGIDETGLEAFTELKQSLEPGPIATAIQKLLARHQKEKG